MAFWARENSKQNTQLYQEMHLITWDLWFWGRVGVGFKGFKQPNIKFQANTQKIREKITTKNQENTPCTQTKTFQIQYVISKFNICTIFIFTNKALNQ